MRPYKYKVVDPRYVYDPVVVEVPFAVDLTRQSGLSAITVKAIAIEKCMVARLVK